MNESTMLSLVNGPVHHKVDFVLMDTAYYIQILSVFCKSYLCSSVDLSMYF